VRAAPLLAVATAGGGYQLTGLTPGRYLVEFFSGCGTTGYATQWWRDARSASAATPVGVKVATTTPGIDAAVSRQ
jgi:hypothetical protein